MPERRPVIIEFIKHIASSEDRQGFFHESSVISNQKEIESSSFFEKKEPKKLCSLSLCW
jgi:hypothetical protein